MGIEAFDVSAGRIQDVEDGFCGGHRSVWAHGVELRTRWGHSYTHRFRFPDTAEGLLRANRFAARVEDFVRANGVAKLDLNQWFVRTIYGTDAYLDEEPDLVAREQAADEAGF